MGLGSVDLGRAVNRWPILLGLIRLKGCGHYGSMDSLVVAPILVDKGISNLGSREMPRS